LIARFEKKWDRIREVSERQWPGRDHPVEEAVNEVLTSIGEDLAIRGRNCLLEPPTDAVERFAARAGLEINGFGRWVRA
jgi:hypothetical protein